MGFKFKPIYIKHQTRNIKLQKKGLYMSAEAFVHNPFVVRSTFGEESYKGNIRLSAGRRYGGPYDKR